MTELNSKAKQKPPKKHVALNKARRSIWLVNSTHMKQKMFGALKAQGDVAICGGIHFSPTANQAITRHFA
jgi:hypothetical protein